MLPPVTPTESGDPFCKRFRSEFLHLYKKPLSSDAYCGFGQLQKEHFNQEIDQATDHLFQVVIPRVASELAPTDIPHLITKIQRSGINVRYLGRVRKNCTDLDVSRCLLLEMIVRAWRYSTIIFLHLLTFFFSPSDFFFLDK